MSEIQITIAVSELEEWAKQILAAMDTQVRFQEDMQAMREEAEGKRLGHLDYVRSRIVTLIHQPSNNQRTEGE